MDGLAASRLKDLKHTEQCKAFEKKIFHKYDKALKVFWIPSVMRYSIWTTDKKGKAYMLCICVGYIDTSAFREPNERDLQAIHKMDLYRKEKSFSMWNKIQSHNQNLEASKKKQLKDDLNAISRERWRNVVGHPQVSVGISL